MPRRGTENAAIPTPLWSDPATKNRSLTVTALSEKPLPYGRGPTEPTDEGVGRYKLKTEN